MSLSNNEFERVCMDVIKVEVTSNYKVFVYIVKHSYILGVMLFTTRKAQLHVAALNVSHLQAVQ